MDKIQYISRLFVRLFYILIITTSLLLVLQWAYVDATSGLIRDALVGISTIPRMVPTPEGTVDLTTLAWTPLLKLLGFCADFIDSLPYLLSLFVLKTLFSHYARGDIFSTQNARLYRKLGLLYVANALLMKPLGETLLTLVATATNAPGHRYLTISFGTPNLSSLFYAALIILMSWIMVEASKMSQENALTI